MSAGTFELGSEGWIDEARRHLTAAVSAVADTLDGVGFSLCEVYTDAPAHLAGPGGEVAWHVVIEGSSVEVGPGRRSDVEQVVTVDHEICIPLAKQPYPPVTEPRDLVGPPRVPKELHRLLVEFHNHMASITR